MSEPSVVGLVEAQAQLIEHNQAMFQQLGEVLASIAHGKTPVPWKLVVNRSKKGFISDLDLIPKTS